MSYLVRVETPTACFGFVVENGVVVRAAPMTRWGMGKRGKLVAGWWMKQGATVVWLKL